MKHILIPIAVMAVVSITGCSSSRYIETDANEGTDADMQVYYYNGYPYYYYPYYYGGVYYYQGRYYKRFPYRRGHYRPTHPVKPSAPIRKFEPKPPQRTRPVRRFNAPKTPAPSQSAPQRYTPQSQPKPSQSLPSSPVNRPRRP